MIKIEITINTTIEELTAKINLHPHGNLDHLQNIGTIVIVNNGTGTDSKGNYDYVLYKRSSGSVWKQGKIEDFPRKRLGGYDLLFRVLEKVVGDRNK